MIQFISDFEYQILQYLNTTDSLSPRDLLGKLRSDLSELGDISLLRIDTTLVNLIKRGLISRSSTRLYSITHDGSELLLDYENEPSNQSDELDFSLENRINIADNTLQIVSDGNTHNKQKITSWVLSKSTHVSNLSHIVQIFEKLYENRLIDYPTDSSVKITDRGLTTDREVLAKIFEIPFSIENPMSLHHQEQSSIDQDEIQQFPVKKQNHLDYQAHSSYNQKSDESQYSDSKAVEESTAMATNNLMTSENDRKVQSELNTEFRSENDREFVEDFEPEVNNHTGSDKLNNTQKQSIESYYDHNSSLRIPNTTNGTHISYLEGKLSRRVYHAVVRHNIETVGELLRMSEDELLQIRNFGLESKKEVDELRDELQYILVERESTNELFEYFVPTLGNLRVSRDVFNYLNTQNVENIHDLVNLVQTDDNLHSTPIFNLEGRVSIRTFNSINRHGIESIEELFQMSKGELLQIRNFGLESKKEVDELREKFEANKSFLPNHIVEELTIVLVQAQENSEFQDTWNKLDDYGMKFDVVLPDLNLTSLQSLTWNNLLSLGNEWNAIEQFVEAANEEHLYDIQKIDPFSVIDHETLKFLYHVGCPLHEITIERVITNTIQSVFISQNNVRSILDIFTMNKVTLEPIKHLVDNVKFYASWLANQSSWTQEINKEDPSPVILYKLEKLNHSEFIEQLFIGFYDRDKDIFMARYGLDGKDPQTLQEVSEIIGVTRERIRQITARKISSIKPIINSNPILLGMLHLSKQLIEISQVIHEDDLIDQIESHIGIEDTNIIRNTIRFFISENIIDNLGNESANRIWVSENLPYDIVLDIINAIFVYLSDCMAPMPIEDIMNHVLSIMEIQSDFQITEKLLVTCLHADPKFEIVDETYWGLKSWDKRLYDDMVMVLRGVGDPMHFKDVATLVNQRLPDGESTTAHNIHAQLGRYTKLFMRTDSGTFGLREWDPDAPIQPPKYVDLMEQVLENSGKHMTSQEVYECVHELRPAKFSSIAMYLSLDDRFSQYGQKYGLRSWEENSPDEHKEEEWLDDLKNSIFDDLWGDD